ncbi:MAG: ribonuclease, partial [Bacteroidetes bacterium]
MAKKGNKKIFVLDTSVILHNHASIFSFQDNDIVIPITVLEELDRFKKGHENKNYEAREFTRIMDRLSENHKLNEWVHLGEDRGNIKVQMDEHMAKGDAVKIFGSDKGDHRILNAALIIAKENADKKVVLVSKDFNLRIKARAVNLEAEDYKTGKIQDIDKLYDGKETIEDFNPELIDKLYSKREITPEEAGITKIIPNQYYTFKSLQRSALAYLNPLSNMIELVEKNTVMKITPRNSEQAFALHAILNDNIKLVTLQGIAGSGKTLLALAAALEQRSNFKQIYLSRPIVPLS